MTVTHIDSERFRRGDVSPETVLRFTLDEVAAGRMRTTRLIVLSIEDADGRYDVRALSSGVDTTEYIALLERVKHHLLMGAMNG